MPGSTKSAQKPKRKELATYHNAVFSAFGHYLREQKESGDIALEDEHQLSKQPPRIDIIIIKKNRDVKIERVWGRIFRTHNIIEYKSPSDRSPTLSVFNKVVYGYAGLYASQEKIKLTDMTATIICPRRPKKLFRVLENEFGYKILQKGDGLYYIMQEGVPVEKSLAVQIVVSPELPDSEFFLRSLGKGIDGGTARLFWEVVNQGGESLEYLAPWVKVMFLENEDVLTRERKNMTKMKRLEKTVRSWIEEEDFLADYRQEVIQEGERKGEQKGMARLYEYLKSGHSIEEAEKMFALQ